MIRAKNYETASKFDKVMQRKLLDSFSGHGVYTRTTVHLPSVSITHDTGQVNEIRQLT